MAEENVFRFISVRAPEGAIGGAAKYGVQAGGGESLGAGQRRTRAQWRLTAEQARESGSVPRSLAAAGLDLTPLVRWLVNESAAPLTAEKVADGVQTVLGQGLSTLVSSQAFRGVEQALGAALLAETVAPAAGRADELVMGVRAAGLIRAAAAASFPPGLKTIGDYLRDTIVVLPDIQVADDPSTGQYRSLNADAVSTVDEAPAEHLARFEAAHEELVRAVRTVGAAPMQETVIPPDMTDPGGARAMMDEATARIRSGGEEAGVAPARITSAQMTLSPETVAGLSGPTRRALSEIGMTGADWDPVATVGLIEGAMARLAAQTASLTQRRRLRVGGVVMNIDAFEYALGISDSTEAGFYPLPLIQQCQAAAGVGDLLIVRQKLKSYEVGDFAHVENVLEGESRMREHRRLNRTEETETTETEKETEKERDLQSTERNELQNEATKTVESQMSLDAGLQISGSYGPAVSFSSNLNVGFSTTTTESQKKAATFSREVTEKSAERVKERVRQERVRKIVEEIEEINKHGIENPAGNGHIRGVYRWLNKIYDAQVFSYGQRMMFDFVVPEPAAFWLYAQIESEAAQGTLPEPEEPMFGTRPLQPNDITRWNYAEWVGKYQVTNVPQPPPEYQTVTYFDRQDGNTKNSMGRSGKIEIPSGYRAISATMHTAYLWIGNDKNSFHVTMGNTYRDRTNVWGATSVPLNHRKEVSIAYTLLQSIAFAIGVDVLCELTNEGWLKWQHDVYDAVIEAYQRQKAAYDEQQRIAAITKTNPVKGDNPLQNVRTMRDELKKWVLMLMIGKTDIAKDGFIAGAKPVLDLDKACDNSGYIRFFENAFEWHNVLWVFYPYFWGREARWVTALHFKDPDPEFAAFLKAGAARVQVPVRPGFERAVAYFMQHGIIWEGHDPPLSGDNTYLPIVDEITENLGKIEDGVPYPPGSEPFEVTIPTSLVVLQNLEEIPAIRDMLTGQPIALMNNG